ncbi:MAG: hypothetical protein KGZ92_03850, partial [Firmicutes bacterium]|nr:hypothetical protein [Dethiobacter sp.]MBS3888421.1 hypothetical protein [Bacillota bacterium]
SPLYCFVWRLNNTTKGVAFSFYSFKLSYRDSDFVLRFVAEHPTKRTVPRVDQSAVPCVAV